MWNEKSKCFCDEDLCGNISRSKVTPKHPLHCLAVHVKVEVLAHLSKMRKWRKHDCQPFSFPLHHKVPLMQTLAQCPETEVDTAELKMSRLHLKSKAEL